ncbi:hypothetical protein K458DRAFT_398772 [Lentithecium fluviatile CBS 122367]|uniref:Mid2 domain-containing protein n=1 Tax=Lentithecium fluviatile CBS 122367 TaxID=1168545 RepID=A0A6G1JK37_9PLEO|nr:hypothetical protein K458DRAFT_398772 [Lentithecium fluviatile CBS 122367]
MGGSTGRFEVTDKPRKRFFCCAGGEDESYDDQLLCFSSPHTRTTPYQCFKLILVSRKMDAVVWMYAGKCGFADLRARDTNVNGETSAGVLLACGTLNETEMPAEATTSSVQSSAASTLSTGQRGASSQPPSTTSRSASSSSNSAIREDLRGDDSDLLQRKSNEIQLGVGIGIPLAAVLLGAVGLFYQIRYRKRWERKVRRRRGTSTEIAW